MTEDSRPMPDPTILTTEQLLREVERVRELLESTVKGVEKEYLQRFAGIDERFDMVERQRVEQKTDTKDAVDAAFSAAKEAVREQTTASDRAISKSETAMLEQLKQLAATFATATDGLRRDFDDLKARVTRSEGQKTGGDQVKSTATTNSQWAFGIAIAIVVLVVNVAFFLAGNS